MIQFIAKRILYIIPVLLGITVIVFTLLYFTPGDPATTMLGTDASQEQLEAFREEHGLNESYPVRLLSYMKGVFLEFDFGDSYATKKPIINELTSRFPYTLKLAGLGILVGTLIGVITGIISAVKQYSLIDKVSTTFALFGVSAPTFWVALMMVLIFSVQLKLFPASGSYGPEYWVLPSVTLGLWTAGTIMRMTRSSMLDVIRQDYIRTARAKGQKEFVVIMKHALQNAMIPIITVIGLQICILLAGAVLTESVFSIPGVGKYIVDSINLRDYPAVQGAVLYVAFVCVIINLVVDLIYCFVDPRMKAAIISSKKKKYKTRRVEV